jgi:hypothetical protein
MAYATKADVYKWIPSGSVSSPSRHVTASASTDRISVDSHGLEDGAPVSFRAESGGAVPSPLVTGTTYFVRDATEHTFKVAATDEGTAISLSSNGTNVLMVLEIPWDGWLEAASQQVDNLLPANATPFVAPYPPVVVNYTALIVASWALTFGGKGSDLIASEFDRALEELKTWRKFGIPARVAGDSGRGAVSRIVTRKSGSGGTI